MLEGQVAQSANPLFRLAPERVGSPLARSHQNQLTGQVAPLPSPSKGVDQPRQVLLRLEATDEEHELVPQLVEPTNFHEIVGGVRDSKTLVDSRQHDRDAVLRPRHPVHDIPLLRMRRDDDPPRSADREREESTTVPASAKATEIGSIEGQEIVDRQHDGQPGGDGRDVAPSMKEVDAVGSQASGEDDLVPDDSRQATALP